MTQSHLSKPVRRLTRLLGLALVLLGLGSIARADSAEILLQQKPSDLLAGESRAICYSGYRSGQHPDRGAGAMNPSDAEILEDLQILVQHNFSLIRLHDSQANSAAVLRLITTHRLKLKVLLGAWLNAEVSNTRCPWQKEPYSEEFLAANKLKNAEEISRAVALTKQYPEVVVALAVGNEALVQWNDHMVPIESIIRYVRQVKLAVTVPVTVADNYDWWAKHGSALAKELDFISVHIYPVWENKDIDEAMAYGIANLKAVRSALPQSRIVISEAGWPTTASEFGPRADEARQKRYVNEMSAWAGKMHMTTFFFSAFDEGWKGDPGDPLGAEKHWGLFSGDREPKQAMQR